jgi:hypothetical protein
MIDPKAVPIDNRNPYKPIDVSGRKPVPSTPDDKAPLHTHPKGLP